MNLIPAIQLLLISYQLQLLVVQLQPKITWPELRSATKLCFVGRVEDMAKDVG